GIAFQRSLVSINHKGPRVFWVSRQTPRSMLPNTIELIIFEYWSVCVGDIRLSSLLSIHTSCRINSFWPSKFKEPAYCVKHVYAHITCNTVTIFHKSTPPAVVRQPIVRS